MKFRIGFTRLTDDLEGLYHAQRLGLDSAASVSWIHADSPSGDVAPPLAHVATATMPAQQEAAVIWAGQAASTSQIESLLSEGTHVFCDFPGLTWNSAWQTLLKQSQKVTRLYIAARHRWDGRLLTARRTLAEGHLGPLRHVRCISRQYVPAEMMAVAREQTSDAPQTSLEGATASGRLATTAYSTSRGWIEMLDGLLQLVDSPAVAVKSLDSTTNDEASADAAQGRSAWILFADGCQAHLEMHRRSLAPLETGWILEGTEGGFFGGRRYRAAADFELIDVPVEAALTDQTELYRSLAATVQRGLPFVVSHASVIRVLQLAQAIDDSARWQAEVKLPPDVER